MNKKIWDLYAPIYERAMRADKKVYQYMYDRIPQIIADKEVLEIATGPGLLAKHVADAAALPYKDDSFDVVLIANALHVMSNPEKALSEIDRVLKPAGVLIAPNFVAHKGTFISRVWSKILQIAGISFEHQWSTAGYRDFLKQNGWEILHSREMQARIAIVYVECVRDASWR